MCADSSMTLELCLTTDDEARPCVMTLRSQQATPQRGAALARLATSLHSIGERQAVSHQVSVNFTHKVVNGKRPECGNGRQRQVYAEICMYGPH